MSVHMSAAAAATRSLPSRIEKDEAFALLVSAARRHAVPLPAPCVPLGNCTGPAIPLTLAQGPEKRTSAWHAPRAAPQPGGWTCSCPGVRARVRVRSLPAGWTRSSAGRCSPSSPWCWPCCSGSTPRCGPVLGGRARLPAAGRRAPCPFGFAALLAPPARGAFPHASAPAAWVLCRWATTSSCSRACPAPPTCERPRATSRRASSTGAHRSKQDRASGAQK